MRCLVPLLLLLVSCHSREPSSAPRTGNAPPPPPSCTLAAVQAVPSTLPVLSPRFSPEGNSLLVTGPKFAGLRLIDPAAGTERTLTAEAQAGYRVRFDREELEWLLPDGRLRRMSRDGGSVRDAGLEPHRNLTPPAFDGRRFYQDNDVIWRLDEGGRTAVSDARDRCYNPLLSPDGTWLLYEGLASGIHALDLRTGTETLIGRGNHPAWMPDSQRLVYDVSRDDGERIVASELHVFDLGCGRSVRLTDTRELVEMTPAVSPDGKRIAFVSGTALLLAEISCN